MADQGTNNDDGLFEEITDEEETASIVVFMQQPDEMSPAYDLVGDVELDDAIVMVVKGLVSMVLDSLGFWDDDDEEDTEDSSGD